MELVVVGVLLLLSGFFSGSETALYRADWVKLANRAERRRFGAGMALKLLNFREATVVAVLVGNNLANVFAAVLISDFAARRFGPGWTPVALVILVTLTLVFGEFLPKAHANALPNLWLRGSSWFLAASLALFAPVVLLLEGITQLFATPLAPTRERLSLTRQDFLSAFRRRESEKAGERADGHPVANLATRLFRFSGMRVSEAQIPIGQVRAVPENAGREEALVVIGRYGFSRIPVHGNEPENLTGVVFAKDLLRVDELRIRPLARIAGESRLVEVLDLMQRRGTHIAAVTGPGGHVTGIVTLEDVLEELVGEIRSED